MRIIVQDDYESLSRWAAHHVVHRINELRPTAEEPFVLGRPTGWPPVGTYERLVQLDREGKVSFTNVVTFNTDEYVGLPEDHPQSYHSFMTKHLFDHTDIPPENVSILDGDAEDLEAECAAHGEKMASYGGAEPFLAELAPTGTLRSTNRAPASAAGPGSRR